MDDEPTHPDAEVSELQEAFPVSYAIFAMARSHKSVAAAELARLGLFPNQDLTVLRLASVECLPQKDLVDTLQVSHPTVVKTVARLEKAGLVTRRTSEEDRRVSLVSLTERGRRLRDDVLAAWRHLDAITTAGLSREEIEAFLATAAKIRASIDRGGADVAE